MKKNLLAFGLVILGATVLAQTPRLSLYEEFTGETCPPCAATNPGLNTLLGQPTNTVKIVPIKWQVPIPSAPSNTWSLYKTNQVEIDWRWRTTASGGYGYTPAINSAPSSKIDGQEATVFGAASGHPANLTSGVIATAQSYTSAFSITMQRDWNYNCSAITVTVNITATAPFTVSSAGKLKFRCVMVERLINFSVQPGTNGEKDFEDVAIKSFPTLQSGTAMADSWTIGQSMTFTMNCPLPSYVRKKSEVAFVGFIQDDGNQKVAQAVRADKAALPPDGLATLAANVAVTCNNSIFPIITVNNTGTSPITSMTVIPYVDGTAGAPINWTGNIAVASTGQVTLGAITSPTLAGMHTFSYNITSLGAPKYNISGNSSMVTFMVAGPASGVPVAEGFSLGIFPPAGWVSVNPNQGGTWVRNTQTGGYFQSSQCMKYDFFTNNVIGDQDEMLLPSMDLTGGDVPQMTFDYAYAQKNTNNNDQLDVMVSTNCGSTWTNLWSKAGTNLATASPQTGSYLPDANDFTQWQTAVVDLSAYNKTDVLVKFVTTSDNGNNLYLDNVNLRQNNPTGISKSTVNGFDLNIFPNPTTGATNIKVTSPQAGKANVTVFNTLGQVVYQNEVNLTAGTNNITLDAKEFATGVYNVVIDTQSTSVTKKLTVSK
jgi:hypothetical protein